MSINIRDHVLQIAHMSQSLTEPPWVLDDVVTQLAGILAEHDPSLLTHGEQSAMYAINLATMVNISSDNLDHLHQAALLHDIGILTLPEGMRHRTEPPTADDYAAIQSHPREGAELLAMIPALQPAAVIVAHHHERWDGCGYPYGLRGAFIPLGSRILAIADTFDTLMSETGNQIPQTQEAALCLLDRLAGSQLDPELVAAFGRLVREVKLSEQTMPALST